MTDVSDAVRDLLVLLKTKYGVSEADLNDLLARIADWAQTLHGKKRKEFLRVIEGGRRDK